MKNMLTFIVILIVIFICYKYFVSKTSDDHDTSTSVRGKPVAVKQVSGNGTISADQNPVRHTRIGKKLDNLYGQHNKNLNEALH